MRRVTGWPGIPAAAGFRVHARLWRYPGKGGWHFANLSRKQSAEIRDRFAEYRGGWGSVPVRVRIGSTEWETSLFPDSRSGTYMFAVKADVRRRENIEDGDPVTATVTVSEERRSPRRVGPGRRE